MPIIDTYLNAGDPTIQATGEYRGTINLVFDDGRIVTRNLRAANSDGWDARLLAVSGDVEASQQKIDAEEGVSGGEAVAAHKQASIEQRAVAYLRAAWRQQVARDAYLLFAKFNDFRLSKGWALNQVVAGLAGAGLTQEEWDEMSTAYSYLSAADRPAIMDSYQTIQDNWEGRNS